MTDDQIKTDNSGIAAGLPIKITGIVFWGMVFLGMMMSWYMISDYREKLETQYTNQVESIALKISSLFADQHDAPLGELLASIKERGMLEPFDGARLNIENVSITEGAFSAGCHEMTTQFKVARTDVTNNIGFIPVDISVCVETFEDSISEYRKNILIVMAVVFFSFGLILQAILKKLITAPFMTMVGTAKRIAHGELNTRFEEQREDEFGFISRFINKALDEQVRHANELRKAVDRIRETDSALSSERAIAEATLESLSEAVVTVDADGQILSANARAEEIMQNDSKLMIGQHITEFLTIMDENTHENIPLPIKACLSSRTDNRFQLSGIYKNPEGKIVDLKLTVSPIQKEGDNENDVVIVFQDVGAAREMERKLLYQASHDWLTGLFNRKTFETKLDALIEEAKSTRKEHAVCYMDLDQFKIVNDTCGHVAGDELLRQIAEIFQSHTRSSDVLARLGGDEFGLLLSYCPLDRAIENVEDIRKVLKDFRFYWDDKYFEIGITCGIVAIDENIESTTEVLSAADIACYAAKEAGRNRTHVFKPTDEELLRRKGEAQWSTRINSALDEDRFTLYYQEIAPLQPGSSDAFHAEVLVRMISESGELLPPMAFLPIAERYKLMPAIDRWVVRNLLQTIANTPAIIKADTDNQSMFNVNLSGESVGDHTFLKFVKELLEETGIPPSMICFEITETTAISDLGTAKTFISEMRGLGCHFALDDFGTGMCSFSYLKNLDVDFLKIDGSYVKGILDSKFDREIVLAVNQIGHTFGFKTVAEFVEDEKTRAALTAIGVDYAQGYGIHKPQALENLCNNAYSGDNVIKFSNS